MNFFKNLFRHVPELYSKEWFESLSDEQLADEREKLRLKTQDPNWEWGLYAFDNEIRRRYDLKNPNKEFIPPVHREHGWYLHNDE